MSNNQQASHHQYLPSTWEAIGSAAISFIPTGFVAAIAFVIILMASRISQSHETNTSDLLILIVLAGLPTFIGATIFGFICGLPTFILGWYFKQIRWWSSTIMGFVLPFFFFAILPNLILETRNYFSINKQISNPSIWQISLSGAVGGFAFWLIWKSVSNFAANFGKNKQYQD